MRFKSDRASGTAPVTRRPSPPADAVQPFASAAARRMAVAGALGGRRPCSIFFRTHCAQDQKGRTDSALSDTLAHGSHERTTERRTPAPSRPSEPEQYHDGRVAGRTPPATRKDGEISPGIGTACPFLCDVVLGRERGVGPT